MFAVGGSAILSGALGGAAAALSRADFDRVASDVATEIGGNRSVGAMETAVAPELTKMVGSERMNKLANISPLGYVMNSQSATARTVGMDLAENAFTLRQNVEGIATRPAVETLMKRYDGVRAVGTRNLDRLFVKYRTGADTPSMGRRAGLAVRDMLPGSKLSRRQFNEEVGKALRRNDTHDIPEVAEAARWYRENVFDPIKVRAQEQGLLPEEVTTIGAPSYLTRVYDVAKLRADPGPFKARLRAFFSNNPDLDAAEADSLADEVVNNILGYTHGQLPLCRRKRSS